MPKVLGEEDFPFPTEEQLRLEHEQDLRRIARETGARRCSEIERERRELERPPMLASLSPSPIYTPKPKDEPTKEPKAPKPIKPKRATIPDGYVTITELSKTWGVPASDCRAMLRATSLTKPEYGWAFPKKDIPKIKKICGVK